MILIDLACTTQYPRCKLRPTGAKNKPSHWKPVWENDPCTMLASAVQLPFKNLPKTLAQTLGLTASHQKSFLHLGVLLVLSQTHLRLQFWMHNGVSPVAIWVENPMTRHDQPKILNTDNTAYPKSSSGKLVWVFTQRCTWAAADGLRTTPNVFAWIGEKNNWAPWVFYSHRGYVYIHTYIYLDTHKHAYQYIYNI